MVNKLRYARHESAPVLKPSTHVRPIVESAVKQPISDSYEIVDIILSCFVYGNGFDLLCV